MTGFLQVIINGLLIGGVYALLAVGLTMIFGVMKVINFAQSEYMMLGMYLTYSLYKLFNLDETSTPYLFVIPIAVIMFIFGIIVFTIFIRPIIGRDNVAFILLTVGLSYMFQNAAQMLFTANPKAIDTAVKATSIYLQEADISISVAKLVAAILAVAFVLCVSLFLSKTDTGRSMRATSENQEIAILLGINPKMSFMLAFGLGAMFAGIAGVLLSPIYTVYPRIGTLFATTTFAVVILGGLGNVTGALFGGLLVGVVENIVGTYIALNLAPVGVFALFIIVMLIKPNGLFGTGGRKA
jgi:branched-chain amino acid transport system permease protein